MPLKYDNVERIRIRGSYNSNRAERYEPGKNRAFDFRQTFTFYCDYGEYHAPGLAQRPVEEARDIHQEIVQEMYSSVVLEEYQPHGLWNDLVHPDDRYNPARYTEAGNTQRPRDMKRAAQRCGREYQVRNDRVLAYWNQLAGIDETTPTKHIPRLEMEAYKNAGRHWVMFL